MKIAVCIFGQPRFFKESAESFRKEFFDMPNHEVDVFIHCWDEVGYTPDDDINSTNEKPNNQELKDEIWNEYGGNEGYIKGMVIESPEDKFYDIADGLGSVIHTIRDEKLYEEVDWRKDMGKFLPKEMEKDILDCSTIKIKSGKVLRYEMGQFYSISQVIQLKDFHEYEMRKNENKKDFKYDLVVRVRTDSFYVPPEIYGNNKDKYYEDKEKYYGALHKYYGGVGIMGHGLKIVCGLGNGADTPKGKNDTGYFTDLEYIYFKNSQIVDIKNAPYERKPIIADNLIDSNGMFSFPWKLHLKDWILVSDSDTADRAWGGMMSTYITYVTNDLIRFVGKKQTGLMPGGEVLNGFAGLIGDAKLIQIPDYTEESGANSRWAGIPLESNKRRLLKVVNRNVDKRKYPFKPKKGEQDWQIPYGGGCIPHSSSKKMLKNFIEYVRSPRDSGNPLCKTYKKNL